jgi:hypothetical protein
VEISKKILKKMRSAASWCLPLVEWGVLWIERACSLVTKKLNPKGWVKRAKPIELKELAWAFQTLDERARSDL